jgi:dTDP-4-amino-4,6-dideoxygalactose transaminase
MPLPNPLNISVTRPFQPGAEELNILLKGVLTRNHFTNHGPLYLELNEALASRAQLEHSYVSNGTISLQLLLKALGCKGEVVTTPFSYVATTNAILWEGGTPVFADIDPGTCNANPQAVEQAIGPNTKGLLFTHVYGIPCDVEALDKIAEKHGIWLVFDAAHAFDVQYKGRSLFSYGTAASASYHATKIFHTVEGGGVYSKDAELMRAVRQLMNFGHTTSETFDRPGINAKNSEFHAAMGLCILPHMSDIIARRKALSERYDAQIPKGLSRPNMPEGTEYNYAYYPVFFPDEKSLLDTKAELEKEGIGTRRYFYPSLNTLPYLTTTQPCPVAEDIASRVLCLPLYPDLSDEEQAFILRHLHRIFDA